MATKPGVVARVLARMGLARVTGKRSAYSGASTATSAFDFVNGILSADQAVKRDLRRLRDRSRDLIRNFAYASRFVQAVAENVAGPHGITLQVRVAESNNPNADSQLNDAIETAFAEWAEDPTTTGGLSLVDLEHLLCEALPQDGAFLVRFVRGYRGNRFAFAVEVLDIDQLDHTFDRAPGNNANEVRQGVEVDKWGRPVAYWLWSKHPSDYGRGTLQRNRVPAEDIRHGYIRRRPGQTHGVPWFAPVLLDEKMLQGFQEAAVTAARVGAANTFFLTADPDKVQDSEVLETSVNLEAEAGTGQVLPPGYGVANWDPKYPNNEFDPFLRAMLQSIAQGLRVSHLTLTGDLRQANYSSMRAGLLPERDAWRLLHGWFVRAFLRPAFNAWLSEALLSGAIAVSARDLDRIRRGATWQPRGFPWVDPLKDIQAGLAEVAAGLNTLTNLCAENGRDFEDILRVRKRENDLAAQYGVAIDLTGGKLLAAIPPEQDSTDDGKPQGAANGDSAAQTVRPDRARGIRLARQL